MKDLLHVNSQFLSSLGVVDWGYTESSTPFSYDHFDKWVNQNEHLPLTYLSDHRKTLRKDLLNVYPSFQSALVFLFSYRPTKKWMLENNRHEIAAYSLGFEGEDYHHTLQIKLNQIFDKIYFDGLERFISLDAQPVLERDLAYRAGLGWFGKNSMLINQKEGSYFIIGSLLLNKKLPLSTPPFDVDHCGTCNACIEACPTSAIDPNSRTLIAQKCIATFTIETFKDQEPPQGLDKSRGEIFGCDICQDVCPWNKKPLLKDESKLDLRPALTFLKEWFYQFSKEELYQKLDSMTGRGLKRALFGTAFDRPGKIGWLKNLKAYFQPK